MNKLKLICTAITCCLYANLAFAPAAKKPKASGEEKTMPQKTKITKKYGTPTTAQEKLLNSYLNPYAETDFASTKRTAEPKQATKPELTSTAKNYELKAIKLIREINREINLDPNYKLSAAMDATRSNLIHLAVFHGYLHLLRELVKMGADINTPNKTLWTPLHIAAYLDADQFPNKLEIVKFLVENGASLENKIADLPKPIDLVRPNCKLNFEVIDYLMAKMFKKPVMAVEAAKQK